jgi:Holliday junction resolvase RusA-like endonuclease
MIKLIIPGKPMGKQRPRVMKSGITYTPKETVNYETLVKQLYITHHSGELLGGSVHMGIVAYFDIPKSAPKKNRELMLKGEILPTKKPDMDNIVKIIADALNGLAYHDDSQIVSLK